MTAIVVPDREDHLRRQVHALKQRLKEQRQAGHIKAKAAKIELEILRREYEKVAIAAVKMTQQLERIKQIARD